MERCDWLKPARRVNQIYICASSTTSSFGCDPLYDQLRGQKMSFFMEKHLIFTPNHVPPAITDFKRYKGFFPEINESSCDRFSMVKEKARQSPESSRSLTSSFSFTDDGLSNASSSFSSGEDSPGTSKFSDSFKSFFGQTENCHKTPKKGSIPRPSPRKPLKPMKSANESDPDFRGVTLQMKTKMTKNKHTKKPKAQLVIDCCFSSKKKKAITSPDGKPARRRSSSPKFNPAIYRLSQSSPSYFTSDPCFDPDLGVSPLHLEKECASCGAIKTPLWRDAEDGTPLCNACGIRYKKYRIRCLQCWYIPKKEEKVLPSCPCCDHSFKMSLTRRGSVNSNSD